MISTAPDKRIVVVEERADDGEKSYYFMRLSDEKKVGFVLTPAESREISKVAIIASWNKPGTNVALLLFYGTKLSSLLVFSKDDDGTFQKVSVELPDPMALYRDRTGKTPPQPGDGYSENKVGPWGDENTVSLISGAAKQTEQSDEYLHLLVTFHARIIGKRAELSHLTLNGPLTNLESDAFLDKWDTRPVEAK